METVQFAGKTFIDTTKQKKRKVETVLFVSINYDW